MLQNEQNVSQMSTDVAKRVKNKNKFFCPTCDYSTSRKNNWLRHIDSKKHKRSLFQNEQDNENLKKKNGLFFCEWCDYYTCKKSNMIKHKNTNKCLLQKKKLCEKKCSQMLDESVKAATFTCKWCEKSWGSRQSLWRHKKNVKVKK